MTLTESLAGNLMVGRRELSASEREFLNHMRKLFYFRCLIESLELIRY